jgi:hypothetical protein
MTAAGARSAPKYRKHKQSGQGIVTLSDGVGGRRDVLLGPYGTKASKSEYDWVVAEWLANGRTWRSRNGAEERGSGLSVSELIIHFVEHAERHYRRPDGSSTSEVSEYKRSLRVLRQMYGTTSAASFGPLALKAVRQRMIDAGWSRGVINQRIGRIKRAFRWCCSEGLVPVAVLQGLETVDGLARGRTEARETNPVRPVPDAYVDAVQKYLSRPV